MEKLVIKINDLSKISLYTDIKSIITKLLNDISSLTKTVPAEVEYCGEAHEISENENYITILSFNKKMIDVNKEKNIANLFSPQDNFFFPDFIYLLIGMFANDLQKKDYYFVQSSVVKYDDEHSIMLLGDPNAGKTTMAYSLMKNYGYSLISNDNVLVHMSDGNLKTSCGTKSVQMRYGGIKLYFPEILPYVKLEDEDKNRNEWDIKVYIDEYLKNQGFHFSDDSIVTDIFNITTFKNGDTFIRSRERIDEILLMYEHLTKQIRSSRYALTGFDFPLPSFESEKYLQNRYEISKQICESTNIYDARGTVDTLTRRLKK